MVDMQFRDTTLTCAECGQEFTFTASEQLSYARKGQSKPRLCAFCRAAAGIASGASSMSGSSRGSGERSDRPMYAAVCSDCGQRIQVPFEPRPGRPVYCSRCYETHGGGANRYDRDGRRSSFGRR